MPRIVFLFTMLAFILGSNFYVFYRLYQLIPSPTLRITVTAFGIISVCSFFVSMALQGVFPPVITAFLYKLGTSWFFIMLYLLFFFLIADLLKLTPLPIERFLHNNMLTFSILTLTLTVVFVTGYIRYLHKERVEITINLPDEQKLDNPVKIVALSDLHLGYTINNNELKKWIDLINHENPDVVLLVGDIIDNHLSPAIEQKMDLTLKKIKSKQGVFAVVGNHEYFSGIEQSKQFLKQCGITLLNDSMILVDNAFYIVGREDRSNSNRKTIQNLCQYAEPSKPIILMDHQPYHLEEAALHNIALQISGHTHGGQLFPISLITKLMYEKSHGYLKKGNTQYFITSGMGIWGGKFRIGTHSEYVVINMQ